MTAGESNPTPITIHHLEMLDQRHFRPSARPEGFSVDLVDPPDPEKNRELYRTVGGEWQWTDKLAWSNDQWRGYACRDSLRTYTGSLGGTQVGYFELETQEGGNVEIAYFGLLPEFIGKGLGGAMLSAAIAIAWGLPGTRRVWVHTCTLDHEHALANYMKRGFSNFRIEAPNGSSSTGEAADE